MTSLPLAAVLLDSDGTLVLSDEAIRQSYAEWCGEYGLDPVDTLARCQGRRTSDAIPELVPARLAAAAARRLDEIELAALDGILPVPGSRELLERLRDARVPHAIVTSGSTELVTVRLRAAGLPLTDVVVTADHVEAGKPDPACYLRAAQALGVEPSRCVVVEDSVPGVRAGVAAGSAVLGVTTTTSSERLVEAGAAATVSDLAAVEVVRDDGWQLRLG